MTTEERQPQITQELLDRARAGDREAMTALYEASSLELYRCIHALIRDEDLTLDVQQQSYLQAFSHLDQLRDARRFLPWLRQIAVNEARMQLRRKQPLLFSQLGDEAEAEEPELPDPRPEASPELALERKERNRLMREILGKLSDGQRLILGMYYYEQMPISRIAADTGLSPGTVKAQLHRGRRRVEEEVRRLEARGVKLCGLSPLPFLLALLKQAEPAAGTGEQVLAAALPQSGRAVEAAAVHVGRRFFQTAGGRVLLGLLAAAAVGGGVLGYGWLQEQTVLGDLRPTEPILVLHTQEEPETPEDLLPTDTQTPEPLTEPETPEDLTEPVTQATEPATEPPTEPTTEPKPEPNPVPAAPNPTQPAAPVSTEPTQPANQIPSAQSNSVTWEWSNGSVSDWNTVPGEDGYVYNILYVDVYGDTQLPVTVRTDDESVLKIIRIEEMSADLHFSEFLSGGVRYHYEVLPLRDGTAQIHLHVNGKDIKTMTVTVKTQPRLLSVGLASSSPFYENTEKTLSNTVTGTVYKFYAHTLGQVQPVISTDNAALIRFSEPRFVPERNAPCYEYSVEVTITGPGDSHIYLSYDGKVERSWSVHASSAEIDQSDSQEDLIPIDAAPQVMGWYMASGLPVILPLGRTESLYVKMKGSETPTVWIDDSSAASISPESSAWHADRNVSEYWYRITPLKSGACTIICQFEGKTAFTVPIIIP